MLHSFIACYFVNDSGKGCFVKRDRPYFLEIFFLVKCEKPVFIFVKREKKYNIF